MDGKRIIGSNEAISLPEIPKEILSLVELLVLNWDRLCKARNKRTIIEYLID